MVVEITATQFTPRNKPTYLVTRVGLMLPQNDMGAILQLRTWKELRQ